MAVLHHNFTTINLKLDGVRAEGEIYLIAMHQVKTNEGLFDVLIGGRYFDKYEKRDGVWKFSHRSIVADWAYPANPSKRSAEHTSELQALMRISYAVFCLNKKQISIHHNIPNVQHTNKTSTHTP